MKKLIIVLFLMTFAATTGNAQAPQTRPNKGAQAVQSKQLAKPATATPGAAAPAPTTQPNQQIKALDKTFDKAWSFVSFWALILFAAGATGGLAWVFIKYKFLRGDPLGTEHGTAAFATIKELRKGGVLRKLKSKLAPGEFHLGIYRTGKDLMATVYFAALPLELTKGHCLVAGATNSGKTYTILLPNIIKASKTAESLFITDVKKRNQFGELYEMSSGHRPNSIYFSPLEPQFNELKFNIIPFIKGDELKATSFARAICDTGGEETHWESSAIQLLAAIWHHTATLPHPNMVTGQRVLLLPIEELKETLITSTSSEARIAARQFVDAAEKEASSILSTCRKACNFLNSKQIQEFCWVDEATDFTVMRRESTSIYYQARITRADEIKGLNSLIFTYLTEQLLEDQAGFPIKILADEFANFGKIPSFNTKITTFRSAGIYVTAILQSVQSQMITNYGKTETETILNSFNTQIALPGLNRADAKMVSDQLGVKTELSRSASSGIGNPIEGNNSISSHAQPLMTPDQITTMPTTSVLVFRSGRAKPFLLERENYAFKEKTRQIEPKALYTVPPTDEAPPTSTTPTTEPKTPYQPKPIKRKHNFDDNLPDWA